MNELMTEVFVKKLLASPGSAKYQLTNKYTKLEKPLVVLTRAGFFQPNSDQKAPMLLLIKFTDKKRKMCNKTKGDYFLNITALVPREYARVPKITPIYTILQH